MKIAVTGASGFVGSRLLKSWQGSEILSPISIRYGDGSIQKINWASFTAVIHLGGLAHQSDKLHDSAYIEANQKLTEDLGKYAKNGGVRHIVFLSSVKVFGDHAQLVSDDTKCLPEEAYGRSKREAEKSLIELSSEEFNVSILRPPLVVGAGAKGNLLKMMRLAELPLPIPLGGINNQRSMIALDNLIYVIEWLIKNPQTGTFLVSEKDSISTSELMIRIRTFMGFNSPRLINLPKILQRLLITVTPNLANKLIKSFQVDQQSSVRLIKDQLPQTLDQGIQQMVEHYLTNR
jgi:nucleoside-diphosphate-sugar epimerase